MQVNNGSGWDGAQDGTSDVFLDSADKTLKIFTQDGNIDPQFYSVRCFLNSDVPLQLTLAAPIGRSRSDGGDDGKRLKLTTLTAQAHVITCPIGFNAKASSGTITFTGAIGDSCVVEAYGGNWYVTDNNGVTVA